MKNKIVLNDYYDEPILVDQPTKTGKQILLYREKISIRDNIMPYVIRSNYYIVDVNGNVLGKLFVQNNGSNNKLEIEYFIREEYRGIGLATIALSTVLEDIFINKRFDNLKYRRNNLEKETITNIDSVFLSINSDNLISQIVAKKNGFIQNDESTFIIEIDDYLKSNNKKNL